MVSVVIPEGVIEIGSGAFENCDNLKNVSIPSSIQRFDSYAFSGCSKLEYSQYDNAFYLGNATKPYIVLCYTTSQEITSCEIHPDTKFILRSAFFSHDNITNITIPKGVISIGQQAFDGAGISSIIIPDTVEYMGSDAFNRCYDLTIYCEAASKPLDWDKNWNRSDLPVEWGYVAN